jgi:hypothetical protein
MAEADTALGKFSQQYGDRALTVEPADGGYVFVPSRSQRPPLRRDP